MSDIQRRDVIRELKWIRNVNQKILDTDAKELDIDSAWIKHWGKVNEALDYAISSLEVDEQYQLEYEHIPTITITVEEYMKLREYEDKCKEQTDDNN